MAPRAVSIAVAAAAALVLVLLLSKIVVLPGTQPVSVRVATPPPLRPGFSLPPGAGGGMGCRGDMRLDLNASEDGDGLIPQDRDLAVQQHLGLSIEDVQKARSLPQAKEMQKWPQSVVHDTIWLQTQT